MQGVGGQVCHLLLACSVNQDIGSSSTATVTILAGVINQGEENTHPCPAMLPAPSQALHTCSSAGSCQGPMSCTSALFLALCHNNNPEKVVLEGGKALQGRGGQKKMGAAGLWDCNMALLHKKHTAERSSHGEWRGGRKDGACAGLLAVQSQTAQQGSIFQVLRAHY